MAWCARYNDVAGENHPSYQQVQYQQVQEIAVPVCYVRLHTIALKSAGKRLFEQSWLIIAADPNAIIKHPIRAPARIASNTR